MKYILVVLISWMTACVDEDREDYKNADRTPAGYHVVYHDAGLLASGLMTYEQILAAFDAAMIRSAIDLETRYGLPQQQTLSFPWEEKILFKLVDHFRFEVGGIMATGQYDSPVIAVAIHVKQYVEPGITPPATALPWTHVIGETTGRTYYGVVDLVNFAPALSHEIGHHFWGPYFEH